MDLKELQKELKKIDNGLNIYYDRKHLPNRIKLHYDGSAYPIYDFSTQKYNEENCLKYIPDKLHTLNALLGAYYADKPEKTANNETDKVDGIFQAKLIKDIKDHLALMNEDHKNGYFELITHLSDPLKIILNHDGYQSIIYNFETKNFIYDSLRYITKPEFYALQNGMNAYWKDRLEENIDTAINTSKNPFKKYTDHLADVLKEKNEAYGDSFSKSVDTYGLATIGIRLSDKYNRIENLITENIFSKNGESLQDTLLDNAGYSILALKYLEDRRND